MIPVGEANIQDGTMIDKFGDPDLMTDFAEEYLKQFWRLLPSGRLPLTVVEIMPALLLLVTAAELALKASWIRSNSRQKPIHLLTDLYAGLDPEQRADVERRFAAAPIVARLVDLRSDAPRIEGILGVYDSTYGERSGVYEDSRFYAEPTTMFDKDSSLRGANLVKGNTPYPVFLPDIARALIDTYRHYTGAERLRRLGARLSEGIRGSGDHNHGDWSLTPSTLSLSALVVSQSASKDSRGQELPTFAAFKSLHSTPFQLDWMHGGNTLLFYFASPHDRRDGIETISGLECRVISDQVVGMHSRDLYLLANELEGAGRFGTLPSRE